MLGKKWLKEINLKNHTHENKNIMEVPMVTLQSKAKQKLKCSCFLVERQGFKEQEQASQLAARICILIYFRHSFISKKKNIPDLFPEIKIFKKIKSNPNQFELKIHN
ncbi:hypothetical protein V6Z11_D06G075000 [Gossypium hirsutum]